MNPIDPFRGECDERVDAQSREPVMQPAARAFRLQTVKRLYAYHFSWLLRPIIKYPQDIATAQQLSWELRSDPLIGTGIAHGGSAILSASMLALLDMDDRLLVSMVSGGHLRQIA